jgi:hypothetical protein
MLPDARKYRVNNFLGQIGWGVVAFRERAQGIVVMPEETFERSCITDPDLRDERCIS